MIDEIARERDQFRLLDGERRLRRVDAAPDAAQALEELGDERPAVDDPADRLVQLGIIPGGPSPLVRTSPPLAEKVMLFVICSKRFSRSSSTAFFRGVNASICFCSKAAWPAAWSNSGRYRMPSKCAGDGNFSKRLWFRVPSALNSASSKGPVPMMCSACSLLYCCSNASIASWRLHLRVRARQRIEEEEVRRGKLHHHCLFVGRRDRFDGLILRAR